MGKRLMSVRLSREEDLKLNEASREAKMSKPRLARELMMDGLKFRLLVRYRKGQVSLGTFCRALGMAMGEAIDFLADLGIRSPISYDDYLASVESAEKVFGQRPGRPS